MLHYDTPPFNLNILERHLNEILNRFALHQSSLPNESPREVDICGRNKPMKSKSEIKYVAAVAEHYCWSCNSG